MAKQILIGTPAHGYLSALMIVQKLVDEGVHNPSAKLFCDGSGYIEIPRQPREEGKPVLNTHDWLRIFRLIGTETVKPDGKGGVQIPVTDQLTKFVELGSLGEFHLSTGPNPPLNDPADDALLAKGVVH